MQPSRALLRRFPTDAAQLLLGQLDEALAERELPWRDVLSGTEDAMQDLPSPSLRHGRGITPDDGDGDDEHPLARKRLGIRALITTCVDTGVHEGPAPDARVREGSWGARARLQELGDAEVDHTWMWRLNTHFGAVMVPEEYVDSVRLRLGCAVPCETCALCYLSDRIPGHGRSPRDLLRVGRSHARPQRRHRIGARSGSVLRLHG